MPFLAIPPKLGLDLSVGAFFFALPLVFVPMLADPAEAPRWALLSVLPAIACFVPARFTSGHALGVAFIAWAAFTLQWSDGPYEGAVALWKLICLAAVFRIGSALTSLRPAFIGLGLAFAVNGALATAQVLGFEPVPHLTPEPAGLFMNKNFLAEPAALVLVGLAACRLWWLALPVLPCLALTSARGAALAVGAAALAWLWPRSRLAAAGAALLLVLAGLAMWHLRTYEVVDSGTQRFTIWSALLSDWTPFGHGLGSFYQRFPAIAPAWDSLTSRPSHAHSDLIELAYETGPGIILLLGFLAFCLAGTPEAPRLVLVAFLAESCLSFPSWFAVTGSVAALCAGHLCRDRPHLRYHLAVGRIHLQRLAAEHDLD